MSTYQPCQGSDPELFFATDAASIAKAKMVCAGCACRSDCLDGAIERGEFGVWGGTDEEERRVIARRRLRLV